MDTAQVILSVFTIGLGAAAGWVSGVIAASKLRARIVALDAELDALCDTLTRANKRQAAKTRWDMESLNRTEARTPVPAMSEILSERDQILREHLAKERDNG
jgi:hypothetical protein